MPVGLDTNNRRDNNNHKAHVELKPLITSRTYDVTPCCGRIATTRTTTVARSGPGMRMRTWPGRTCTIRTKKIPVVVRNCNSNNNRTVGDTIILRRTGPRTCGTLVVVLRNHNSNNNRTVGGTTTATTIKQLEHQSWIVIVSCDSCVE